MGWYTNFPLRFIDGKMGEIYRAHPAFQRLSKEHPDLVAKLRSVVSDRLQRQRMDNHEALEPIKQEMQRAFDLMSSYVSSDQELM